MGAPSRPQRGKRAERLLELLKEHGPMTAHDLAVEIGSDANTVSSILARHKPERCHIGSYVREMVNRDERLRARYHHGPGKDVKPPPKLTPTEISRRYRARKRQCVASVFQLGVALENLRTPKWLERRKD